MIKGTCPRRACRIARDTMHLSVEAAAHVDTQVAHIAHKVRPAQLDRLVEEAIGRFMPEEADRRRRQAADGRNFTIDTRQPSRGTSTVSGELDLADALDLDAAVAAGAQALKDLGSTESLDVRRPAVGTSPAANSPRPQHHPDAGDDATDDGQSPAVGTATGDGDPGSGPCSPPRPPRRRYASPVRWSCTCTSPTPRSSPVRRWKGFGRVENTGVRCTPSRSGSGAATPTPKSPSTR